MSWLFGSGLGPPIPYPARLKATKEGRIRNGDAGLTKVIQPDGGQLGQGEFSEYDGEGRGNMDHDQNGKGLAT